jgi:hypothetical protein
MFFSHCPFTVREKQVIAAVASGGICCQREPDCWPKDDSGGIPLDGFFNGGSRVVRKE